MCIVIDTCVISSVLNPHSVDHREFRPVLEWISSGPGKMVYGGTKYKRELSNLKRYLGLISEWRRAGKCRILRDDLVDQEEARIHEESQDPDFDDAHILAILIVGRIRLVCTKDDRSIRKLKNKNLHPPKFRGPKFYTSARNVSLLSNRFIVGVCKQ